MKKIGKNEIKKIQGGVVPYGSHICGTRYWAGLCYCDYCWDNGLPMQCDIPCYYTNCTVSGTAPSLPQ